MGAGSRFFLPQSLIDVAVGVLDLLYVPSCAFCRKYVKRNSRLCRACERELVDAPSATCQRCGMPFPAMSRQCVHCRLHRFRFDQVVAVGSYSGIRRQAVLRMKKSVDQPLVWAAGELLGHSLAQQGLQADCVTCVPTHWWRRWSRGFWPTGILGAQVARHLGVTWSPQLVRMTRPTAKQGTLLPNQRRQNVRNAFQVNRRINLSGQHVLLVDDVMTTGATANELCRILRKKGAERITVGIFARGTGSR